MRKRSAKRGRMRGRHALARFALPLPSASLACAAIGLALPSAASAATEQFTAAGCTTWPVPAGVTSVEIEATGAAGEDAPGNGPAVAGRGDRVSATASGLAGGQLFVCVDSGGGTGDIAGGAAGGDGGGASGVALGSDFSAPLLVAGGGGGAGSCIGSPGGGAGMPVAADGGDCGTAVDPGGGGNNTTMQGGAGGAPGGAPGAGFTAAGPGVGGDSSGGGGGGGYFGGGGGAELPPPVPASAGGGGGTDFCAATISGCTVTSGDGTGTGAGSGPGDAKVVLTYAEPEPPKADGTLTIDANKGKVEKGHKVTLLGQIDTPTNQGCEAGRTVELQRHKKNEPDSEFHTFATVQADAAGHFELRKKVELTKLYRAIVTETNTCDDETSNSHKVRVQKRKAAPEA